MWRRFAQIKHGSRDSPPEVSDEIRREGVQRDRRAVFGKGEEMPVNQGVNSDGEAVSRTEHL